MGQQPALLVYCLLLSSFVFGGCAAPQTSPPPVTSQHTNQEAFDCAINVLQRMHFEIDKADPQAGLVETFPLRGGQWFEFWRQDNATPAAWAQANTQSLRRRAKIQINATSTGIQIDCKVQTERLNVPAQLVTSSSQVYRILTESEPLVQHLEFSEGQKSAQQWTDIGADPALESKILQAIRRQLEKG